MQSFYLATYILDIALHVVWRLSITHTARHLVRAQGRLVRLNSTKQSIALVSSTKQNVTGADADI